MWLSKNTKETKVKIINVNDITIIEFVLCNAKNEIYSQCLVAVVRARFRSH